MQVTYQEAGLADIADVVDGSLDDTALVSVAADEGLDLLRSYREIDDAGFRRSILGGEGDGGQTPFIGRP